jgi:hypothetical protein
MFVLILTGGLCCAWFVYPIWCRCRCLEIGAGFIDSAQLSRLLPEDEDRIQFQKCCVLGKKKNAMMDNVQKCHRHKLLDLVEKYRFRLLLHSNIITFKMDRKLLTT